MMKTATTLVYALAIAVGAVAATEYPPADIAVPVNDKWTAKYKLSDAQPTIPIEYCENPEHWALTFDDGPSMDTLRVLQKLREHNIKATFFIVGSRVPQAQSVLQKIHQEGHQIALHSWSHHDAIDKASADQILAEMLWNMKAIYDVTGVVPKYARPPKGVVTENMTKAFAALGLELIMWTKTRDTNDWKLNASPPTISEQEVLSTVSGWLNESPAYGSISLQHDVHAVTTKIAVDIIDMVAKSKFKPVTLAQCIGRPSTDMYFPSFAFPEDLVGKAMTSNPSIPLPQTPAPSQPKDKATEEVKEAPKKDSAASAFSFPATAFSLIAGLLLL